MAQVAQYASVDAYYSLLVIIIQRIRVYSRTVTDLPRRRIYEQVCVQLPASVFNMTLPAFAAERRAAARCCLAPAPAARGVPCSNRSISPVRGALSSKPATCRYCGRSMGQKDRRTDGGSTVT